MVLGTLLFGVFAVTEVLAAQPQTSAPTASNTPASAQTQQNPNAPAPSCDSICNDVTARAAREVNKDPQSQLSQLETQCMAYKSAGQSSKSEKIVLALNMTATATCGTACFTGMAIPACTYAGLASSTGELIQTLVAKESMVGKTLKSILPAWGLYSSVKGLKGGEKVSQLVNVPKGSSPLYGNSGEIVGWRNGSGQVFNSSGQEVAALESVGGKEDLAKAKPDVKPQKSVDEKKKADAKNACRAAAMFGLMTGARVYGMKQQGKSKDAACKAVQQLYALGGIDGPGTTDTDPDPDGNDGTGSGSGGATGHSGGTATSSTTLGSTGDTASAIRAPTDLLGNGLSHSGCMGSTACRDDALKNASKTPNAAAVDADVLKQSGLDKLLAPKAAALDMESIGRQLSSGGNPAGLLGAAGGGSMGGVGPALAELIKAAASEGLTGIPGSAYASGNGAPQGAAAAQGENGLPSLMGDQALGAASLTEFGKAPSLLGQSPCDENDIWHTNCVENTTIFSIISDRITRSRDKVENLPWARSINRELSGSR